MRLSIDLALRGDQLWGYPLLNYEATHCPEDVDNLYTPMQCLWHLPVLPLALLTSRFVMSVACVRMNAGATHVTDWLASGCHTMLGNQIRVSTQVKCSFVPKLMTGLFRPVMLSNWCELHAFSFTGSMRCFGFLFKTGVSCLDQNRWLTSKCLGLSISSDMQMLILRHCRINVFGWLPHSPACLRCRQSSFAPYLN